MTLPNQVTPLFTATTGAYTVGRSLRYRASASAKLTRTPSVSSNRTTWTWSGWVKRGALSNGTTGMVLFWAGYTNASTADGLVSCYFSSTNQIGFYVVETGVADRNNYSNAVYRDPSAWYHCVFTYDATNATASNRQRIYVNGEQVTSFAATSYVSQNYQADVNSNSFQHGMGLYGFNSTSYFDGYMAEVNFVDGQALTPSSFGAYDTNGVWQPKKYSGTYGTNGFYLPFSDNSALTTASNVGLGKDFSGNGNYWVTNNFSITAGSTYDSMIDSPTVGASSSNYAVLNPLTNGSYTTLSGGNLNTSGNTVTNNGNSRSSFAFTTGKWYAEFTVTGVNSTYPQYGIMKSSDAQSPNNAAPQAGYGSILNSVAYRADGTKVIANTSSAYGSSYTTNDVIGIAIDADNGAVYFSKNGTFQNSGVPTSGSSKTGAALTWTGSSVELVIAIAEYNGSGSATNFGQRPFSYTPPTGYSALNTYNLPAATINNGALYNAATLYTGTGASQAIINSQSNGGNNPLGSTFAPDFIWIKSRSLAVDHALMNTVVGATFGLSSNNTGAEFNQSANFSSFNSNGFTVQGTSSSYNQSSATYVAWQWKGGGTAVTNNSGSISSQVSANTSAGFSAVTYTGTGANATIGHGLGVAPQMVIVKKRSAAGNSWRVYHVGLTSAAYSIELNTTAAQALTADVWNSTAPTSTVFSIGTGGDVSTSAATFVAYCFAAVNGYSSFGSYTGNGSTDGPFIFTGHRPRWVMVKKSSAIGNWLIFDTSRSPFNVNDDALFPNLSNAETTTSSYNNDFLSNGFKIRTSDGSWNDSGVTYIYASFAESPFQIARAR